MASPPCAASRNGQTVETPGVATNKHGPALTLERRRHEQERPMARRNKSEIAISPEADQALQNVTALAHRLAAGLAGEELPASGRVETPTAAVLAMSMFSFLSSIDPDDLQALFLAEGSMKQFTFKPRAYDAVIPPLFANWQPHNPQSMG